MDARHWLNHLHEMTIISPKHTLTRVWQKCERAHVRHSFNLLCHDGFSPNPAGNPAKAEELYLQSIVLRRLVKDRRGEADVLNNPGQVFAQRDEHAKAIEYLAQALVIRRQLKDKTGEAITLRNLGKSYVGWPIRKKRLSITKQRTN
ncbi:MAG: tetratricopeptide repeat protein [Acidobacteria bacterium]|nr:tetratricopeptide repeat protein [Acidobacteriota bacterium]